MDYQVLVIPGGFTYGDDISAGKIMANEIRLKLGDGINKFVAEGRLVLGICNGFQVLVKTGILPGIKGKGAQPVTLTNNDSGKFECRWVYLKVNEKSPCVFTKGMDVIMCPSLTAKASWWRSRAWLEKLNSSCSTPMKKGRPGRLPVQS